MTSVLRFAPYEEIGSLGDLPGPDGLFLLNGQLVNLEADLRDGVLTGRGEEQGITEMGDGRRLRMRMTSFIRYLTYLERKSQKGTFCIVVPTGAGVGVFRRRGIDGYHRRIGNLQRRHPKGCLVSVRDGSRGWGEGGALMLR